MSLPLAAFDSFIRRNGVNATLLCRGMPLDQNVEHRVDVRGFLEAKGFGSEFSSGIEMSYMRKAFHLPAEEMERSGVGRPPQSGDILELQDKAFFVRAVHHITYRDRTVRYVLELAGEDV